MKILAVIPARGGSKRILHKNVKDFYGKPIIAYSIDAALKAGCFEKVMVSTDDPEIAKVARRYGASIPFMRSAKTSDDYATTADVIAEVLRRMEVNGHIFDAVACIYATAPFVTPERLKEAAEMLERGEAQSVFTCVEYSYPIQRSLVVDAEGRVAMKYPEYATARSQDLEKSYHDAGQFYFSTVRSFCECGSLWGPDTRPIILPELEVQDLDTPADWKLAELKFKMLGRHSDMTPQIRKTVTRGRTPGPRRTLVQFKKMPVELTDKFPDHIKIGRFSFESYTVMDDMTSKIMLRGRNDPEVARHMVNRKPVSTGEHNLFVDSLRSRDDKVYYAVTHTNGDVIGSVNLERTGTARMERGIWIDPSQWGKDLAVKLLARLYDYIHRAMGVAIVETKVRLDNAASRRLEEKLGAEEVRRDDEYVYYETRLSE